MLINAMRLPKCNIVSDGNVIDREVREVTQEYDTLLQKRNYANAILNNKNDETDLNTRRVYLKGALNSVVEYAAKHNYHS